MRSFLVRLIVILTLFAPSAALAQELGAVAPDPARITEMAGTWDVTQRTWTGPNAEPTALPAAVAERSIPVGGGYLFEAMTLASGDAQDKAFTRTSYLNRNAVDGVFEYFSVDSRAPQQMHYHSQPLDGGAADVIKFAGGEFTAAQWGDQRNVTFAYRSELEPVQNGRQRFALFLRPLEGGAEEFLAFEYVYVKRP